MLSSPQCLMGVSGQLHVLATIPPRKEPLAPTVEETGQAPELVWIWW